MSAGKIILKVINTIEVVCGLGLVFCVGWVLGYLQCLGLVQQ